MNRKVCVGVRTRHNMLRNGSHVCNHHGALPVIAFTHFIITRPKFSRIPTQYRAAIPGWRYVAMRVKLHYPSVALPTLLTDIFQKCSAGPIHGIYSHLYRVIRRCRWRVFRYRRCTNSDHGIVSSYSAQILSLGMNCSAPCSINIVSMHHTKEKE